MYVCTLSLVWRGKLQVINGYWTRLDQRGYAHSHKYLGAIKCDSKNNHLLSLLLRAAIRFVASLYIPDEDDSLVQAQISCQPKSNAEELIHFGA